MRDRFSSSARLQVRVATFIVGAAIVGGWLAAGQVEDRVSGDGETAAVAAAQRVQPFDPSQPAAEFHRDNANPFRVPSPRTSVQPLLAWSFAARPVPAGWKRFGIRWARRGDGNAAVRTNAGSYELQLESPLVDVPPGEYQVVLDGDVAGGGLQLLVLASTGEELARGLYWSGADRRQNERMTIDFRLDAPARVSLALANWSVEGKSSWWRLRRLTLLGRRATGHLVPVEPLTLAPELADVVDNLRALNEWADSTWERATIVRDAVRNALPQTGSPATVAAAIWTVSSHVGLSVRLVRTAASALNEYDSYATTEVWLPEERRWVIVDAYFGGHWTRGRNGRLIGIAELSRLIRARRGATVYWHSAPAARSLRPSRHYVDPLQLHAHYAVLMQASGREVYVRGTDEVPAGVTVYREQRDVDLATTDPDEPVEIAPTAVPSRRMTKRPPPSFHRTGPLRYAGEVLLERTFTPKFVRGRSRMTIVLDASEYGYVTVSPPHAFTLTTGGGQYELAETTDGRVISPVVLLNPRMTLSWRNLRSRKLTVRAWSAATFPENREIRSAVPPVVD